MIYKNKTKKKPIKLIEEGTIFQDGGGFYLKIDPRGFSYEKNVCVVLENNSLTYFTDEAEVEEVGYNLELFYKEV